MQPPANHLAYDTEWLLNGEIDKPVYFSSKITEKKKIMDNYPQLNLLYEKTDLFFG
ncbi:MAG: hypothetical protein HC906_10700 [Bacteroidales bacterium]|nr:hypothetical protein [Bacteroidales bacterium]